MEKNNVLIFYDPAAVTNHNPRFGSLECGDRVKITEFSDNYKIIYPRPKPIYQKILNKIHRENPVIKFLLKKPFELSAVLKCLGLKRMESLPRNCHKCTFPITSDICPVCHTLFDSERMYRFIYGMDSNIPDSDTTYITPTSLSAINSAVSLVCQMVESKKNAFAIIRPPGHHASGQISGGFCLVNNIAVGAEYALTIGFKKIFIFDFDAHHGNGTQNIFYHRRDVYYCSIHTIDAYPKTGNEDETGTADGDGFNLNIIVPKKICTENYLQIFESKVLPAIKSYDPDLILVSAGFDGLESDPMAIMNLTSDCYGEITKSLVKFGKPVQMVLEGGYNLNELPKCIEICIKNLVN